MIEMSFDKEIDSYIQHLDSQAEVLPLVMGLLSTRLIQASKCFDDFLNKNDLTKDQNDNEIGDEIEDGGILIHENLLTQFINLSENIGNYELAYKIIPTNFIVSFVSQYDAYLGRLIKAIYTLKPNLLNNSDKNLLFSDLLEFDSIDDAKQHIIEKEVESVLRENHIKQFKWLENKLNMTLTKGLPSFTDFVEITERRNLFVHCNGVISKQYIDVCARNGVPNIDTLKIGDKLEVPPSYFSKCYSVLFEIGVKLGQVLWRKLQPDKLEDADHHLNNVCFELLKKGHNKLAFNLLSFATDILKKHHNQEILLIFTINKSLSYYLSAKKDKAQAILKKTDWSATNNSFKLAVAVLTDNYDDVYKYMRLLGNNDDVLTKLAYLDWPLFKEIRETEKFKEVFNEIFKEEMIYVEDKPKGLEEILIEHQKINKEIEEKEKAANNV